jgi:MFS family permease
MTCTTFVLGGVAAFAPKYIHDRIGRLQITEKTIDELRKLQTTNGERKVPDDILEILDKLKSKTSTDVPEMRNLLAANLPPETLLNYLPAIMEHSRAMVTVDGKEIPEALSLSQINLFFGVIVVVAGFLATRLGGVLGERLRKRVKGAYFLVCGYSAIISFPFFLAMILVPFPYAWFFLFAAVFGLFFNTGPANTITANVTHSSVRANAFAFNILVIHLFGDAISPILISTMAGIWNWETAMIVTSLLIFLAGVFWLLGSSSLDADTAAAEQN